MLDLKVKLRDANVNKMEQSEGGLKIEFPAYKTPFHLHCLTFWIHFELFIAPN